MMPIPVKSIYWDRNVGGLNLAKCENIIDLLELADCNNVEIRPIGGYGRRGGFSTWITHSVEVTGICHWLTPSSNTHVVFYDHSGYLYRHSAMALTQILERETLV